MQVAISRGRARAWDHAQLVHAQWLHIAQLRALVFIKRVATDDNLADLPSRGDFHLLSFMKAVEVSPVTHSFYDDGSAWAELQERWQHS